jgi:hypothetical protein
MNVGDILAGRASAEQAYRRSGRLPEHRRLMAHILNLDTQYDHGPEVELLKSYRRLYPYSDVAANLLGVLYMIVLDDQVSAEPHLRAAYELNPSFLNLDVLTNGLWLQGKGDEIARIAQDQGRRTGQEPATAVVKALMVRRDWQALLQALDRYDKEEMLPRAQSAWCRVWAYLFSGRLRDAQTLQEIGRREELKAQGSGLDLSTSTLMWLRVRLGRPVVLSEDELARAAKSLWNLRWWAVVAVEANAPEPLASLVARFQETERGSQASLSARSCSSRAGAWRSCAATRRQRAGCSRPLVENSDVSHRFHVLARIYDAQDMRAEAAGPYEVVVSRPNVMAAIWPALGHLDRFRLAQVYERLGDTVRARTLYERFAGDWKDGDSDIPELATARQRLAVLSPPLR